MKEINKILDKLDLLLKSRKPWEIYAISGVLVAVVGFATYKQIIPLQQKKINASQVKLVGLEKTNINFKKAVKDNEIEKQTLKEMERESDDIEVEISKKKNSLEYILTKIKKQNTIKYSDKQWGLFYKTIQEKAIKHNLEILEIKNQEVAKKVTPVAPVKKVETKKSVIPTKTAPVVAQVEKKEEDIDFKPVFEVELKVIAPFKNLLDFLVDVEKNKLITNMDTLYLSSVDDKNLSATIKINLWGVK